MFLLKIRKIYFSNSINNKDKFRRDKNIYIIKNSKNKCSIKIIDEIYIKSKYIPKKDTEDKRII